jgi:SAM-dependent methyltransferase
VEAVRFMLGEQPVRVVDLGAGTGIFTRLIASLGHEVVAVEPDDGMLAKLLAVNPKTAAIRGSAQEIPLPDESVDVVVAAQSYHWFDTEPARREIARVLRPGGIFAPIWNLRDESVPWVAELSRVALLEDGTRSVEHRSSTRDFGPCFAAAEWAEFPHAVGHTAATLRELIRSRSYYLVASATERRRLDDAVETIAAGLPPAFALPYITLAYRAVRAPGAP